MPGADKNEHETGPGPLTAPDFAAGGWLLVALSGQFSFFLFLLFFYAVPAAAGDFEAWNANILLMQPPYVEGKPADTVAFGAHAMDAGVVALTGGLQLIPVIRRMAPTFHHWNGRLFLFLVVAISLSGYYLTWIRGPVPTSFNELATSVNGVLILGFAALAVAAAVQRRISIHERWAVRLFLVSNAQWFLRIGGFGYFAMAQSLGAEVAFDGWFFQFWMWGCFLAPLAIAEIYFRTRRAEQASLRWGGAGVLWASAILTLLGSAVFSIFTLNLLQGDIPA